MHRFDIYSNDPAAIGLSQRSCISGLSGKLVSYLLVRSLMMFQSRGKMLSFIRFLNTHMIFSRNSWAEGKRRERGLKLKPLPVVMFHSDSGLLYLQLIFALKVFHQVLEVDICHLTEKRQEAGHVLSLPTGSRAQSCKCMETQRSQQRGESGSFPNFPSLSASLLAPLYVSVTFSSLHVKIKLQRYTQDTRKYKSPPLFSKGR